MTETTQGERISLYFKQGNSDKVYQASIEPSGTGFVVTFAYGRRGSMLQTGTKTPVPVDYAAAKKVYDKLVAEKTAKGYTPGSSGTPYQQTANADRVTGILPQLLNPVDETAAYRLMADDGWVMQEKFDGKRILIRRTGDQVIGINRKGLAVALPEVVAEVVRGLRPGHNFVLDGESIGDVYHAFDLLELAGQDLRPIAYRSRLAALADLVGPASTGAVRLVTTLSDAANKQAFLAELRQCKAEGAVFKRLDAKYNPGRPASGGPALKLKFTATASCIVARTNGAKRSVKLEVLDPAGNRVGVGNVTIPVSQPIPAVGSIADVRYLYVFEGGSLFQPVYLGVRDDLTLADCVTRQLKFKPSEPGDDDSEG